MAKLGHQILFINCDQCFFLAMNSIYSPNGQTREALLLLTCSVGEYSIRTKDSTSMNTGTEKSYPSMYPQRTPACSKNVLVNEYVVEEREINMDGVCLNKVHAT